MILYRIFGSFGPLGAWLQLLCLTNMLMTHKTQGAFFEGFRICRGSSIFRWFGMQLWLSTLYDYGYQVILDETQGSSRLSLLYIMHSVILSDVLELFSFASPSLQLLAATASSFKLLYLTKQKDLSIIPTSICPFYVNLRHTLRGKHTSVLLQL